MSDLDQNKNLRMALPNLEIPAQVNSIGTGLINIFVSDLFDFIDKGLKNQGAKLSHGFAGTECQI